MSEEHQPDGGQSTPGSAEAAADTETAGSEPAGGTPGVAPAGGSGLTSDSVSTVTDAFVHAIELVAAAVFAVLFGIGVVDLILQIITAVQNGSITNPERVIGFIDTGLLLLIIVEVYRTVIAYTQESDTQPIVRLVIYTGVIAMVRKVIIFRTSEYSGELEALYVAGSYTIIIAGLIGLLLVERVYTDRVAPD